MAKAHSLPITTAFGEVFGPCSPSVIITNDNFDRVFRSAEFIGKMCYYAAARLQIAPATNLFNLTASQAALKKKSNNPDQNAVRAMMMESMARAESGGFSPGPAVGQTAFVNFAGQMIANGNGGFVSNE